MAIAETEDFREMELWEHLQELRQRLIRSVTYVAVGLIAAWALYKQIFALISAPLLPIMKAKNWQFVLHSVTEGFMLQLQVSLVSGLIIAIPLVTLEIWGFVAPGLTKNEKKACRVVFPLSIAFFFLGITCGYSILSPSLNWFVSFIPEGFGVMQNPIAYITFMVKMVVAFGICFQLPIVLMFLAFVGLVTSQSLREQWRMWVVGCFVLGAVATPGGDPFSMVILAAPMAVLYVASIGLVAFVEKLRDRHESRLSLDAA